MSNVDTQIGWFYLTHPHFPEVLCYRCNSCTLFSVMGDGPQRVYCCGEHKTKPEEGFLKGRLPRVASRPVREAFTLPSNEVIFTN
jgi:hypothetical protein